MDIFDKIFSLPVIKVFNPIYKKYKSIFLYLFFGALTTAISVLSFAFFERVIALEVLLSNVISWILAVTFAYVTNKKWVFCSQSTGKSAIREAILFAGARVTTLVLEEILIFVFVVLLGLDSVIIKIVAQVVVLVLNYIASKILVFKKRGK